MTTNQSPAELEPSVIDDSALVESETPLGSAAADSFAQKEDQPKDIGDQVDKSVEKDACAGDAQERLAQAMATLAADFQGKLKYDAQKDLIIDKLHAELQEYRNGLIQKLLRPMIQDAVLIADNVRKLTQAYTDKDPAELDPQKLLKLMATFPEEIDDLLFRQGVDGFESESAVFDPKLQKVVERVTTDQRELDKTIARRVRQGYKWDGLIVRPEWVAVYVYGKPEQTIANQGGTQA